MKRSRTIYTPSPISRRKADLILCSDAHLREDTPTCWIGDFQQEQWGSLMCIKALQDIHDCVVLHAGDLFDHWKPSPWLISMTIEHLPKHFFTIYGQHDLPQHNWELREKSGIYTLEKAGILKVLSYGHWGRTPEDDNFDCFAIHLNKVDIVRRIYTWHHMTYITPPFPGASEGQATAILRKYPQYDLIVTGDNHQSFATEYKGRLLVNPGSMTRQTAAQIDFQPRVALWYADTNTIEWVNLPIAENAITREHIEVKERRDERIDAFISRLDNDWKAGMSFTENLEAFFNKNNTREPIKEIIYKAIDQ